MRIYEGGIQRILGVVVNIRAGKKTHREKYVTTNLDRNSMTNKKHSQTVSPRVAHLLGLQSAILCAIDDNEEEVEKKIGK